VIAFADVSVRYRGARTRAVDHVSLDAPRGRLTAIVGPNGSGKSTLVRALIGQVALESGTIEIDGSPVSDRARPSLARRVAVVTQREEPAFPLGVREYVGLGRYPHLGLFRGTGTADTEAIARAVERTEIEPYLDRAITELSGGEWQRVRLARALAQGGESLVLDEPTTFLDVAHEMAVFELLARLTADGQAVLLVSHQLNLVARFAHHMVLMRQGHVVAAGTPADVMQGSVLERVYDWPLVVTRDPAVGSPTLVPLRARPRG
jgi:ABC-type cobalamin/Fe3+-siderophores transport system ATPase subunit